MCAADIISGYLGAVLRAARVRFKPHAAAVFGIHTRHFAQKIVCSLNIVNIYCNCCYCMSIFRPRVYSDVAFHAKTPLISLFGRVHFGIACFLSVLRGTRRVDYGRVNNRVTLHHCSKTYLIALNSCSPILF